MSRNIDAITETITDKFEESVKKTRIQIEKLTGNSAVNGSFDKGAGRVCHER